MYAEGDDSSVVSEPSRRRRAVLYRVRGFLSVAVTVGPAVSDTELTLSEPFDEFAVAPFSQWLDLQGQR
ncbi:hypothetical protein N7449_008038 [Penicillium cf. viridicatum]|uniref:Uncharacterized protein n=1 Tax=Penicillium cf. viridicatum TaxID=2972119 RepID=A0A9W9MD96_9EURO|nr:hypothetical protein N7449_008038 [Penicillium cf. viridicatum]